MKGKIIRWVIIIVVVLGATFGIIRWQAPDLLEMFLPGHEHCIKCASMFLLGYAEAHDGRYPESPKGWGDALLLLAETPDDTNWIPFLVGVDDDGSRLERALRDGSDVDESRCTRIYVQGLTRESHHDIVMLFDRYAIKGGDHFRGLPGQVRLREVLTVSGFHRMIGEDQWPEFVERQRELLRGEGFDDSTIDGYYASTLPTQANKSE